MDRYAAAERAFDIPRVVKVGIGSIVNLRSDSLARVFTQREIIERRLTAMSAAFVRMLYSQLAHGQHVITHRVRRLIFRSPPVLTYPVLCSGVRLWAG